MASAELAAEGVSIVVKGIFSPALFSPGWLLMQELIGPREFDAAEVQIIAQELAAFKTDWLDIHVTADTFQASTTESAEYERLRDVVVGVLQTLSANPVGALGINRNVHFGIDDSETWHAFGDSITPKEFWNEFMRLPGMKSVTMLGVRDDKYSGQVQITVEPSTRVRWGVFVSHNDHHNLAVVDAQPASRADQPEPDAVTEPTIAKNAIAVRVLSEEWEASMARANGVIRRILGKMGDLR